MYLYFCQAKAKAVHFTLMLALWWSLVWTKSFFRWINIASQALTISGGSHWSFYINPTSVDRTRVSSSIGISCSSFRRKNPTSYKLSLVHRWLACFSFLYWRRVWSLQTHLIKLEEREKIRMTLSKDHIYASEDGFIESKRIQEAETNCTWFCSNHHESALSTTMEESHWVEACWLEGLGSSIDIIVAHG